MYYRDAELNFQAMTIALKVSTHPVIQDVNAQAWLGLVKSGFRRLCYTEAQSCSRELFLYM